MKQIDQLELFSINMVSNGLPGHAIHIVREDGWKCVQRDCDGTNHYYIK